MSENSEGAYAANAAVDLKYRAPRDYSLRQWNIPIMLRRATSDRSHGSAGYRQTSSVSPANRLSLASSGRRLRRREGKGWLAEGKKEGGREGRQSSLLPELSR